MDIKNKFEYSVSGYYVTILVEADDDGVEVREMVSMRDGVGEEVDHTDELEARLTAELNETLEIEHDDGEWSEIVADAVDDERIANDSGFSSRDAHSPWAPALNSMPLGYQVQ